MKTVSQSLVLLSLLSTLAACSQAPNTIAMDPTVAERATPVTETGAETFPESFPQTVAEISGDPSAAPGISMAMAESYVAPDHYHHASEIVTAITPANTTYQRGTHEVSWAGFNGANQYLSRTDCSGFLTALLTRSYSMTPTRFNQWLGQNRPSASTYYNGIINQNRFIRITSVSQIRPGDILAAKYLDTTSATGHIMIAADSPVQRTATNPIIPNTTQWELSIIDQSSSGHGPTDTRRNADGTFRSGLGQGILRLYANSQGEVEGYTWSTFSNSAYYDSSTRPLALGRLQSASLP